MFYSKSFMLCCQEYCGWRTELTLKMNTRLVVVVVVVVVVFQEFRYSGKCFIPCNSNNLLMPSCKGKEQRNKYR